MNKILIVEASDSDFRVIFGCYPVCSQEPGIRLLSPGHEGGEAGGIDKKHPRAREV